MVKANLLRRASLVLVAPILACGAVRQAPQPMPTLEKLSFDVQTVTPTVMALFDAPTTPPEPTPTATRVISPTETITSTLAAPTPTEPAAPVEPEPPPEPVEEVLPTATSEPIPTVPPAEPVRGGEWDFEAGFGDWSNPYGDSCDSGALGAGWNAFTTRDEFGSSCMNRATWADNVYTGENSQEITFAFIGNEAGIFKSTPTTPGHRYTVEAFVRREFSPTKVQVLLGIDPTGGADWQAETVQWFPWDDDAEDQWSKTEETVIATGESMTIFIKGFHPAPDGGGALRIDSISIIEEG